MKAMTISSSIHTHEIISGIISIHTITYDTLRAVDLIERKENIFKIIFEWERY